jgi:tetratricopeptide (TPR) repeat protein
MIRAFAIVIGLLIALVGQACAATRQDYDDCGQTGDPGRSAAACTRIVSDAGESAIDRVAAYVSLGNDYAAGGDLGRAVAMYSLAIQMDPTNIYAFAARAAASERMGDRAHALADYEAGCKVDPARFIEVAATSNELKALGDAGSPCELPKEYGAIVWGWADDGDYVGMKFGAKSPEEAAAAAISRCLAQCSELSSTGSCQEGCNDDLVRSFGPGECGYFTIGQMNAAIVVPHIGIGHTKEEALEACRSDLTGNYECDEEPIGGCNK